MTQQETLESTETDRYKSLNVLRDIVHGVAKEKGWHSFEETEMAYVSRFVANVHGETSELWESARKGTLKQNCDKLCAITAEDEELADILIRVLDYCGRRNIDIAGAVEAKSRFNATRPYRHGGKAA